MPLNRRLNLVFPVDTDKGEVFVHSTPISREVFEKYYRVIAKTMAVIYGENLSIFTGPRVAFLTLRDLSQQSSTWDGPDGVNRGLVAEIKRLSNVVHQTDKGWVTIPYTDAISDEILTPDDAAEVEGILCFFTFASWIHHGAQLPTILAGMSRFWGGQTTQSNCTAYAVGLQTSTVEENSGETENTLLVTSSPGPATRVSVN